MTERIFMVNGLKGLFGGYFGFSEPVKAFPQLEGMPVRLGPTNCLGPSGEMISKFKLRVVGDGVEIMVAVDQAGQTLLDDVEERVERRECRVPGIGHDLLLGCCVS